MEICEQPQSELDDFGQKARKFVLENKNSEFKQNNRHDEMINKQKDNDMINNPAIKLNSTSKSNLVFNNIVTRIHMVLALIVIAWMNNGFSLMLCHMFQIL